jgi:hypothetical protein
MRTVSFFPLSLLPKKVEYIIFGKRKAGNMTLPEKLVDNNNFRQKKSRK